MKISDKIKNSHGFTLIEMIVVMGVFTIIITIAGKSFDLVVKQLSIVSKSEESNSESVVGLEIFRRDLTQPGYGLFTDVRFPYVSSSIGLSYLEASATPSSSYNDAPSGIPRAVLAGNNLTTTVLPGTDYLVLKGTTLAINKASQKWSYIDGPAPTTAKVWGQNDFTGNEFAIAVTQQYSNGVLRRTLINDANPAAALPYFLITNSYDSPYKPEAENVRYYYYGIREYAGTKTPRAPFNRTDYLVKRVTNDVLATCSPDAGTLYKSTMNYGTDGTFTDYPILDCVADMQIVFGWNVSGMANNVDYYTNADNTAFSGTTTPVYPVDMADPAYIRQHLKLIKVYILAQDGGLDRSFTNTNTNFIVGDPDLGETALTKSVNLTSTNMKNYRWKLHKLIVRPNNLN